MAELPFAHDEYRRRWKELQRGLGTAGLDCLILTSERNFEYVTGFRTPAWLIKSRPMMTLLTTSGDPLVLVPAAHLEDARALGLVSGVRAYAGFERAAADELLAVLREEGLERGRIGLEAGREQRMGLPLDEVKRVSAELPAASFEDAAEVIWRVRTVKSEEEIVYLRGAGEITGHAYSALLGEIGPGWSERAVYSAFATRCMGGGADAPGYVTMTDGPGAYHRHASHPGDRTLQAGELFWMDGGCINRSYFSDYTRCAAVGRASASQRETYERVLEVLDHMLEAVRPGPAASAVFGAAQEAAARSGLSPAIPSRVGHGIGLDLTEPPSLAVDEEVLMEEGMALAVEVGVLTDEGWFHLEENVVVRGAGCEFLSQRTPRELPVATGAV